MSGDLSDNQQHLRRMQEIVQAYYAKRIDFGHMINNLEALLDLLEDVPSDWRDAFLREWGRLEDILAVSLDRAKPNLVDNNQELISDVLENLLALIEKRVESKGSD